MYIIHPYIYKKKSNKTQKCPDETRIASDKPSYDQPHLGKAVVTFIIKLYYDY